MNQTEFSKLARAIAEEALLLLKSKGQHYSTEEDKGANFKHAARVLGVYPERALIGMKVKHDVSVLKLVSDLEEGQVAPLPIWREKILDSINYLILLYSLVVDRLEVLEKIGCTSWQETGEEDGCGQCLK